MTEIDPKKTALIIVDMLNDFVQPDGTLVVPSASKLVPNQKRILEAARKAGATIIYLTDNHMPDDPEFKMWPPHAVAGTKGAEVIEELAPQASDRVIPKRRYSGFFGTDLDLTLREAGITTIILVGVLTDICVMYTSADASARNYDVYVVTDATGSSDPANHDFAIKHMKSVHGTVPVTTEKIVEMFRSKV